MRKINRAKCLFLAAAFFLTAVFSACEKPAGKQSSEALPYRSFRDVPGITNSEINAVEALQKQGGSFVYGMLPSIEAFDCPEENRIMGFSVLFCEWLSGFFEIPFRVSLYEWDELLEGMENGKIDFAGDLTRTGERLKNYYMTDAIVLRPVVSFRIPESKPLPEILRSRIPCYVFLEGSSNYSAVSEASQTPFEAVFAGNYEAVFEILENGEADAFFDENIAEAAFDNYGPILKEYFYPPLFGEVSMSTQKPGLEPVISIVQKTLETDGGRFLCELYDSGQEEYRKHRLFVQLSDEEKSYINDNPVVFFAAENDNYPISFYNAHEKEWQGIAFDILREVENLTGISFKTINSPYTEWEDILEILETGKASMISELVYSDARKDRFLWPATPLINDHYALLSRAETRNITLNEIPYMDIGLMKGSAHAELFRKWFPNHKNTTEYENPEAAFAALEQGKVDMIMASQIKLLRLTHYQELAGYKSNVVFNSSLESSFGFNRDSSVLCTLVDKALKYVDRDGITGNWMAMTYDFQKKTARQRFPWFVGASGLLLSVLVLLFVLFHRNRHEGRQLEEVVSRRTNELAYQTTTLTTILNSVPDLVYCKDVNLRHTQCNKSFEKYYGISEAGIVGKRDMEALGLPIEEAVQFAERERKVISEVRAFTVDEIIPCIDGSKQFFETIRVPLVQDDVVIGLLGISRNITQRKAVEEEALIASATKSTFLANMSHEIRTPMNSIIGFSELALDDEIPSKTRAYLRNILENSEWLLQILNDVLDISKIEAGRMELENIPFDLQELFVHCRTIIMPKTIEKGISLQFNTEPILNKKLIGDPTKLRQVIINFLSNAVKFTDTGAIKVSSFVKHSGDDYKTIFFEVKDSGIGMTGDQIQKIFEPFLQADTSTTRKYGGTGLGLSITKSIIEAMGGELYVESIPGLGSKFSFEVTFNTVDADDNTMDSRMSDHIERPFFEGEVLICEDNHMNQIVICDHLTRVGLKSVVAENGRKGVEIVQDRVRNGEKPFDLIFMDIHMPEMDGLEAATRIDQLNTGTPIVAMTANLMSEDKELYEVSGMDDCMSKPFTSQELWRCLLRYFKPVNRKAPVKNQLAQDDEKLHELLRVDFVKSNQGKYSEIEESLKANDIKLAHRLVHTLKSNAGLIGKTRLEKTAADMERLLSGGKNLLTESHMNLLKTELNTVLEELAPLLNEIPPAAPVKTLGAKQALKLLEKLEPLLESGNPECLNFVDRLYAIPGSDRLVHQLEDFDFRDALPALNELKRTLEKV